MRGGDQGNGSLFSYVDLEQRVRKGLQRLVIAPERMEEFCAAMGRQLQHADIGARKAYLRLFVERIEVDDEQVRMFGHKGTLQSALQRGPEQLDKPVPSFVREWRPQWDSNPCSPRERTVIVAF